MKKNTLLFSLGILLSGALSAQQFLQIPDLEFAISPCGTHSSNVLPPEGYHPNVVYSPELGGFGIVADPDGDGWDVGAPTLYCGDYIYPGSPVEGFSLQVGDAWKTNNGGFDNCGTYNQIPATSLQTRDLGDFRLAVWTGVAAPGVSVRQSTLAKVGELMMVQRVKICNNSGADLESVYYQRYLDPDPDQVYGFNFITRNTVLDGPIGGSGIEGAGTVYDNCRIAMLSADDRSQGSFGGFFGSKPTDGYNGENGFTNTGSNVADVAIQLTFNMGTIADGTCDCAAFVYAFDRDDYRRAYAVSQLVCGAFDAFDEDDNSAKLSAALFGSNYFEENAAVNWAAIDGGFQLQDIVNGEQIEVFDLNGRLILSRIGNNNIESFTTLPSGMYVVRVSDAAGQIRTAKTLVP